MPCVFTDYYKERLKHEQHFAATWEKREIRYKYNDKRKKGMYAMNASRPPQVQFYSRTMNTSKSGVPLLTCNAYYLQPTLSDEYTKVNDLSKCPHRSARRNIVAYRRLKAWVIYNNLKIRKIGNIRIIITSSNHDSPLMSVSVSDIRCLQ